MTISKSLRVLVKISWALVATPIEFSISKDVRKTSKDSHPFWHQWAFYNQPKVRLIQWKPQTENNNFFTSQCVNFSASLENICNACNSQVPTLIRRSSLSFSLLLSTVSRNARLAFNPLDEPSQFDLIWAAY